MSVYKNSIQAFIQQILDYKPELISTQDREKLQQLSSQLPDDNDEISEILENWLKLESRSQLLEAYKQYLILFAAEFPIDGDTNIGIANSKSQTQANQPSEPSKELVDNAIKNNSPLSENTKPDKK
ncbi:hypothetical protein [Nostoc sp.]|uniref:hypothetical protein n=1 Tax=Nostoc sp. TaxID=1180 RepID=UPI002FF78B06